MHWRLLLTGITFISCAPFFALAQETTAPQGIYKITAYVRDSAGITGIVGVLEKDTVVDILGEQGMWYRIKSASPKMEGWTAQWIIEKVKPAPVPPPVNEPTAPIPPAPIAPAQSATDPTAPAATNTQKQLGILQLNSNVRTGPMQAILAVLSKGTEVELLGENNGWYQIEYAPNQTGWVAGWLVQLKTNANTPATPAQAQLSSYQQEGIIPSAIDTKELNEYWISKINELRQSKSLRQLNQSETLVGTAATWADALGAAKLVTHIRANGSSMHQWAKQQGVVFAQRYSKNGWQTNYFTENLGWRYTKATMEETKNALDSILASFVAEGAYGSHYQTVYHPDWNSAGAGFYFEPMGGGTYKLYAVFHYGSLVE